MRSALPSRVAVHEAGHAVVHLARGHSVYEITVVPNEDRGSLGHVRRDWMVDRCQFFPEPDWLTLHEARVSQEEIDRLAEEHSRQTEDDIPGAAAGCVAGEVAERIAFGDAEEEDLAGDYEQLAEICFHFGIDDESHQRIQAEAYALADEILAARWPGVLALAAALDERKTLTQADAEEVLRAAPASA
jgi:hypothetical protein